ncbi:uncharacterized protein BX664DRAFT_342476 [Halteromyces radiatus]|uniref:uncharacterized protein n=1 Tax=Halteromyces radiatus TaxID=101107 RepID=UPI0022211E40|nr:uncharacterized protein BX664DRAFT_342476 [Halteromyces radiatus]KAI8078680.1 hypothetical protein BX664DRAFT_342476 [Halteromyces radiatus]
MYYITLLILLCISSINCLNFIIPLPNTLIIAGTSSFVTWGGLGNATATNLYLANGPTTDQLTIINIFGQNLPSSTTSMWITIPKDAPNDNTYLVLEGNDTPPSRATVPLTISFGATTTPSAVPTGPSSSSSSSIPSSSVKATSSSIVPSSSSSSVKSSSFFSSHTSSSNDPSSTPSSSPSSSDSEVLSSGQTAGIIVGAIGAAGLTLAVIFFIRRKRRHGTQKRNTELFNEKGNDMLGRQYGYDDQHYRTLPFESAQLPDQSSYARTPVTDPFNPPVYYPMKSLDTSNKEHISSNTQLPSFAPSTESIHKPDEATFADRPDKPHTK